MANPIRRRLQRRVTELTHPGQREIDDLRAAFDALALELRDLNATTTNGYRAAVDQMRAEIDLAVAGTTGQQAAIDDQAARATAFEEYVRQWVPESIDALRVHVETHIGAAVENATDPFRTRLRRLERATETATSATRATPPAGSVPRASEPAATAGPAELGLNYSAFEDELRGSPEHVMELEAVHVATIAGFGANDLPVVDVGCGRGELLVLLRDAGVAAVGVDVNPVSVAECTEAGLDVVDGDAVEYLRSLAPGSLRAVCGLHIVEHMTDRERTDLFRAAYDAVAVGGGIIMETPNPENLRVGSTTFWLDPTHLRPVPPQLLEFQIGQAGFDQIEVQRLHPGTDVIETPADADPFTAGLARIVNDLVSGPMDYAVIGRKVASDLDD